MATIVSGRDWVLFRGAGSRSLLMVITFDESHANPEMTAFLEYDRTTGSALGVDHRLPLPEAAIQVVLDALSGNTAGDQSNSSLALLYRQQYGIASTNSIGGDSYRRPDEYSSHVGQGHETEGRDDETTRLWSDAKTGETSQSTNTSSVGAVNNAMAAHQAGPPTRALDVDLASIGAWAADGGNIDDMNFPADINLEI